MVRQPAKELDSSQGASALVPAKELDCRGLNCPLPVLKTKKALVELQEGDVLKLVATDPGSVADITAFSRRTGHELVQHSKNNGEFVFYIRK